MTPVPRLQIDAPLEVLHRWRELKAQAADLDAALRARYRHDPVAWAHDRLGVHLWSKQRDAARLLVAHPRVAVRSAHGVGKSFLAAVLSCWWIDVHPPGTAIIISTAPSHEQVHAVLWEEIRRLHGVGNLPGEAQRSDRWLDDAGRIVGMGRRPPDHAESAFQGIHREYVLVILDEAGGIPSWLWTAGEAITTGADCRMLAIGNPDNNASEFARVCTRDPGWHPVKISAFDSPNLTGETIPDPVKAVLVSAEWVEDKQLRWGPTNPLYQAKVLGEFADSEDGVIPLSWVTAAQDRWRAWADHGKPAQPGRQIIGVDPARYGVDKTALAIRHGDVIERIDRYPKTATTEVVDLVQAAMTRPQALAIVDVVGLGAGVVDQLRQQRTRVQAFNGATHTRRRDKTGSLKFNNARSASIWGTREQLDPADGPTIALPPDDELAAELTVPTWKIAAGGTIVIESKDEIRKRLGRSPDSADAVTMALWTEPTPILDELGRAPTPSVHAYADSVGAWG